MFANRNPRSAFRFDGDGTLWLRSMLDRKDRCEVLMEDFGDSTGAVGEASSVSKEGLTGPVWSRFDLLITSALLLAAATSRFINLENPPEKIFDEAITLGGALNFLHGQPYRDANPPFPTEMMALSIRLFGDHPWSWRIVNASLGTALVGLTYMLARRMFNSRLVGTLAAGFVLCDGLFLVDSRLALWEIFYLTFAAFAYLMTFRFARNAKPSSARGSLALIGLALGLAMGSKLGIPVVTVLLVVGSILFIVVRRANGIDDENRRAYLLRETSGVVALIGGLAALVYLLVFLPNYWFRWWHGIRDQIAYYHYVYEFELALGRRTPHPYASPWWSWPLLLRPMLYNANGEFVGEFVATSKEGPSIRAIGNPIEWWGALVATAILARQVIARGSFSRTFLVTGYLLYLGMWVVIPRWQFAYYYMPALYLGFIALAAVLADSWRAATLEWEEVALMIATAPVFVLGLGIIFGGALFIAILNVFFALRRSGNRNAGRLILVLYVCGSVVLFVYFLPFWYAVPLTPAQFRARMWLSGPGLPNWI
jgi:dolichyl-phosphate-mannose--protein O-mannosyl transferase